MNRNKRERITMGISLLCRASMKTSLHGLQRSDVKYGLFLLTTSTAVNRKTTTYFHREWLIVTYVTNRLSEPVNVRKTNRQQPPAGVGCTMLALSIDSRYAHQRFLTDGTTLTTMYATMITTTTTMMTKKIITKVICLGRWSCWRRQRRWPCWWQRRRWRHLWWWQRRRWEWRCWIVVDDDDDYNKKCMTT